MEAYETFEHAGVTVELHADYDAGNPYEEMEEASRLVWCDSVARREHFRDVETVDDERGSDVAARYLTLFGGEAVVIPFDWQDGGSNGQRAYLHADASDCEGFVCVSREKVDEEWVPYCTEPAAAQQLAEDCARAEFATWAAWLEGDVHAFVVAAGTPEHDSCWGFYGPGNEYVREEAKAAAVEAAHSRLEREARLRTFLLDPSPPVVPSWEEFKQMHAGVAA
jgi:hypothetical protein